VSENITGSEALAKVRETPKALAEALTIAEAISPWLGAAALDIGAPATDRSASAYYNGDTLISIDNPANGTGVITSVEAWASTNIDGFCVGTFEFIEEVGGGVRTYKCRDSDKTIGSVTAGSKQTFSGLDVGIAFGDCIGCYFTSGRLERDDTGYAGVDFESGEHIDPDDGADCSTKTGDAMSLYGMSPLGGQTFQAHISEDITGAEAIVAVSGLLGVLAEAITASEVLAVQWDLKPSVSEALTAAETLDAQAAFLMSMSEDMTAAEALDAISTLYAAMSESLTESEALARMVESTHTVAESLTTSEAVALVRLLYRALSDNVGIADSSVANLALYLLTLKLYARALTLNKPAARLTVKLPSRDYTAIMEA